MRGFSDQPLADVALEPGEQGESHDEGRDSENESCKGRSGNDSNLGVSPAGQDVAPCQKKGGQRRSPLGLISGKRMTSRIESEFVKSIARRSIPIPSPAAGGMPYERASM